MPTPYAPEIISINDMTNTPGDPSIIPVPKQIPNPRNKQQPLSPLLHPQTIHYKTRLPHLYEYARSKRSWNKTSTPIQFFMFLTVCVKYQ